MDTRQCQNYRGPGAVSLVLLLHICFSLLNGINNFYILIFLTKLINILFTETSAGHNEKRLLHHLLDHYNVLERPVANESDPLQLSFGLTLMQIIDVVGFPIWHMSVC